MAGTDYESVLCVKNEVFVYKIPPRPSNRGYRAADWKLDQPDWTGRLRVVAKGKDLIIKLEDKNDGQLFAQCPVDQHPGPAVEAVMDSSRYFVIRIMDDSGRTAFIGLGFSDRSDSFDLNVAIQDHFKWLRQEQDAKQNEKELQAGPKLDLSFKEGQTITLNIGSKKAEGKARPKARCGSGGIGLLPPPPGGVRSVPPPSASSLTSPPAPSPPTVTPGNNSAASGGGGGSGNMDLLGDLDFGSAPSSAAPVNPAPAPAQPTGDLWGDFTSAGASAKKPTDGGNWVQF